MQNLTEKMNKNILSIHFCLISHQYNSFIFNIYILAIKQDLDIGQRVRFLTINKYVHSIYVKVVIQVNLFFVKFCLKNDF